MNNAIKFGYIHAHIAGDNRYGSSVEVFLNSDGSVTVTRKETGAKGGMDGPGGSTKPHVAQKIVVEKPSAAKVALAVKACFDDVIRKWGKPAKNFYWGPSKLGITGVSAQKAAKGLEWARTVMATR